jgi:ankyrin repeat protein
MLGVVLLTACTDPKDEHLWLASMRGQPDNVRKFIGAGADPNYVRGGWSILMRVAREGRPDIAEILIENGAKINFKGKDGASAVTIASEHGNTGVARVLLAKGGDVNIRNDHGNTALMYGAEYGHTEIVRLLLAAGADVTLKDVDGETALMIAQRRGHVAIVELLQDAGDQKLTHRLRRSLTATAELSVPQYGGRRHDDSQL